MNLTQILILKWHSDIYTYDPNYPGEYTFQHAQQQTYVVNCLL